MTDDARSSYEDVPYESNPLAPTHPDNLAVAATFGGLDAPAVDHCRVLELGCASGGNVIPLALALPDSEFLGIDLAPSQIEAGRRIIERLGLRNVRLAAASILDVGEDWGTFDYVICHGVYSWVPPEVQDRILAICGQHLSPHGVGYVSYNTYPGWHLRGMVREMLLFHVREITDARQRIEQARAFLEFLVASSRAPDSPFNGILKDEVELLQETPDSYLFHEHLERDNRPLYFHQFVERLGPHGLQYLAEARPSAIRPGEFPAHTQDVLQSIAPTVVHLEQYLDFLRQRTFRRSLVCRGGMSIDRDLSPAHLASLHVASWLTPARADANLASDDVEEFRGTGDIKLSTSHPWVKTALAVLGEHWPVALRFDVLSDAVASRLGGEMTTDGRAQLEHAMIRLWISSVVDLHVRPPHVVIQPADRPVASALARLQAEAGRIVTSLRHRMVQVTEFDRLVLPLLDGSRDRPALEASMRACLVPGTPAAEQVGDLQDPAAMRLAVERSLRALGSTGLLVV